MILIYYCSAFLLRRKYEINAIPINVIPNILNRIVPIPPVVGKFHPDLEFLTTNVLGKPPPFIYTLIGFCKSLYDFSLLPSSVSINVGAFVSCK